MDRERYGIEPESMTAGASRASDTLGGYVEEKKAPKYNIYKVPAPGKTVFRIDTFYNDIKYYQTSLLEFGVAF